MAGPRLVTHPFKMQRPRPEQLSRIDLVTRQTRRSIREWTQEPIRGHDNEHQSKQDHFAFPVSLGADRRSQSGRQSGFAQGDIDFFSENKVEDGAGGKG